MPITIAEIAQKAGVSRSTVSRALKDHPNISQETRDRVQRIANELGYVPNLVAQSLSINRTLTLGMVITRISDPFVWPVMDGVEQVAHDHGFSVFFSTSRNDTERARSIIEIFQRRRVDGVIINSSHMGDRYSARLSGIQIPVVLINNQQEEENLHSVSIDDIAGAKLATDHLLSLGHKKIAYIGPANRITSNEKRQKGYYAALEEAGILPSPDRVFTTTEADDFDSGQQTAKEVLKTGATAVFCYNDMIALGLITELRLQGLAIPKDMSVIGFDDVDSAKNSIPPLTTIQQPKVELGRQAVKLLLDLLADRPAEDQILPCKLINRGSTTTVNSASAEK